jgi:putative restriction endonuclease
MRLNWTREEIIMALFLYKYTGAKGKDKKDINLLNVAKALERTPASVAMKVSNLMRFDPELKGTAGLKNGGKTGSSWFGTIFLAKTNY